jgi:hypothetical protein
MNMRLIHFSLYEFALLVDAGFSIIEAYDAIILSHQDEPEVLALFHDLKEDWAADPDGFPFKMVKPFAERMDSGEDFLFARAFAELGSMTSMAGSYFKVLAYLFLLKRRVTSEGPEPIDVEAARSILGDCASDQKQLLEAKMRAWSDAPPWAGISDVADTPSVFPAAWMDSFHWGPFDGVSSAAPQPESVVPAMPSRDSLVRHLTAAGMLDELPPIDHAWEWYADSYAQFG